jgi:hypothetical protein
MSSRSSFWAAFLVFAVAAPASAQPTPAGAPSPLLLVQGIREAGMPELALEYLKEVEPKLTPEDRVLLPLERAKCVLSAAEDEPDEGTRTSMIGEAKEGFNAFLIASGKHPRASEASLALARLTSIEAKAQLNRGRRMEVPPKDDPGYDEAVKKQRAEMEKARPLFLTASKQFAEAAGQLKDRLKDPNLDPATRQAVAREVFDADLASAVNKYNLADTFVVTGTTDTLDRDKYYEDARATFAELAKGPPTSRNVWIARAWMAKILADQGKPTEAADEFAAIMASRQFEAEDGKRLVRFFQIERKFLKDTLSDPITTAKLQASAQEWRVWLARYGNLRKPTPEVLTARYLLALAAQLQAQSLMGPPPKPPAPAPQLTQTQRTLLQEAERLYRDLGQSDNDYTARAGRNRTAVVRKLLGEADRPPSAYPTFEEAQMAALIQMAKLNDAEKLRDNATEDDEAPFWARTAQAARVARASAEVKDRKYRVISLLEHAREIATDRDNPGDVTDNLLRLVYFYQLTDQPYQAAVLGEHIARTIKTTGGKGATAGLIALNGYVQASTRIKAEVTDPTMAEAVQAAAAAAKKSDRERAVLLARFLDEQFPNDTATDAARHRLALLLNEEGRTDEAFDVVVKIRPAYSGITGARQLEGYLAAVLVASKESPATPERKRDVFRRAALDLGKVAKPGNTATEEDVRGYLSCRLRLAQLFLSQSRADPEAEANAETRGFKRALEIADEVIGTIPTFDALVDKEKKAGLPEGLNLDGLELRVQAFDVRTRALYLRGKSLVDEKQFPAATAAIAPVVADIGKVDPAFAAKVQQWAGGDGDPMGDMKDELAAQKKKIADLAAGIDKVRRDIVMVGFKLHAIQGQPAEANKMLDLLRAAGGGVEANQSTLELMARELAAQIPALRKENKPNEAKALGDGLAILLKEFTAIKNLRPSTILFLGQTFFTVGQNEEALAQFARIKVPTPPASLKVKADTPWWTVDATKIEDIQERKKFQDEIRDYRFAQLYTAKAYRATGKLAEAEKLLKDAVGDQKAKGFAYGSLDYRRELGHTYEAKGAAQTDSKAANVEWQKAIAEWSMLFRTAQDQVRTQIKPKTDTDPGTPPEEAKRIRNNFFDAYFEPQRVIVTAYAQLIKNPAELEKSYARVAKSLNDLETVNKFNDVVEVQTPQGKVKTTVGEEMLTPEVALRYWELIDKNPALKNAYKAAGGKFFLTKPKGTD